MATQYSVHMRNTMSDVKVFGRVTNNELSTRFTPAGAQVLNVNVAVSRSWKPQDSEEYKTKTAFLSCAVWAEAAERAAASLHKGDVVIVEFSIADLEAQSYTAQDGTARASLKVGRASVQLFAHAGSAGAAEFAEEEPTGEPAPSADPIPF